MIKKTFLCITTLLCCVSIAGCNSSSSQNNQSSSMPSFITRDIIEIANKYDYSFDPTKTIVKEKEAYDYNNDELLSLKHEEERDNHFIVYKFEGIYNEGYESSNYFGDIYLWDDGLYSAQINQINVKGFWFNCSLSKNASNDEEEESDCLVLVSNQENYERIAAESIIDDDCYDYSLSMNMGFDWAVRNMTLKGYSYYPDVAIVLDSISNTLKYKKGDLFIENDCPIVRIIKNLNYMHILDYSKLNWDIPNGMIDSSNRFIKEGEYQLTVHYKELSLDISIQVV